MNRGDVVLVDWPYSDRTGSKLRPAVFVQADYLNGLLDDTVRDCSKEIGYLVS
jgi:mRNA-degrading endonuclease toxin of MazEF toxin-antitoxin module